MLTSKKKGQISVEALIIVGVLVIGGIIFASVFLGNINNQTKKANELSGITDDFMNDLEGWNTPGPGPGPGGSNCGNHVCENPPENQSNCSDCEIPSDGCNDNGYCEPELGETAANCDDCQSPTFSNFVISKYAPTGDSPVNSKFSLKAEITSSYPSVEIYDIKLTKFDPISYSWSNSNKCAIKGTAPDAGTGIYPGTLLMTIEDVSLKNHGKIIDEISCSEEGEYRFSALARPKGVTGVPSLSDDEAKIITSAPVGCGNPAICESGETCATCTECCTIPGTSFGVLISSPTDQKYYNNTDNINFIAITAPELKPGETDSCVWYVNEKIEIPLTGQQNSCSLSQVSLSDTSVFSEGLNKITVYAQRSTTAGKKLEANASVGIYILKPINPGTLYLLTPRNLLVGENFNLMVYGTNQGSVNAPRNINNFTFTGNKCVVTSSTPTCGTTTVNGTDVYYCDYPAICSQPAYSQTGVHNPTEITASMTGTTETAKFYSEYDLWFDFGNCSVTATSYGKMHACLSSSSGMGYNSDYWNNSSGLLKANVDVSFNMTKNINGTLKVYVE
ncbi:MAG TPA: hypothetical protein PK685_04175 [archaeon]|nr:hypothetical protein [archaeon]